MSKSTVTGALGAVCPFDVRTLDHERHYELRVYLSAASVGGISAQGAFPSSMTSGATSALASGDAGGGGATSLTLADEVSQRLAALEHRTATALNSLPSAFSAQGGAQSVVDSDGHRLPPPVPSGSQDASVLAAQQLRRERASRIASVEHVHDDDEVDSHVGSSSDRKALNRLGPKPATKPSDSAPRQQAVVSQGAGAADDSQLPSGPEDYPENWKSYETDEGHTYYYNKRTGSSVWEKPDCLKTEKEKDPNFVSQKWYEDEGYDPFEDEQYFDSYTDMGLQGEMIGDEARSNAYLNAVMRFRKSDFEGKVVLDCGAGTGLLSYFAVRAGAKRVYAIEGSTLAEMTQQAVSDNKLSERIIVYHGRMEEIELPEQVDVIISEWMGSILIFESMLGSVLHARDRWLKPGGMLYPSRAKIYTAPIEAKEYFSKKIDFWSDVYGLDMRAFLPQAQRCCTEKPMFDRLVEANDVLAKEVLVIDYDLMTMTIDEIEVLTTNFDYTLQRDGTLHGFAVWFDVTFESSRMRCTHQEQRKPPNAIPHDDEGEEEDEEEEEEEDEDEEEETVDAQEQENATGKTISKKAESGVNDNQKATGGNAHSTSSKTSGKEEREAAGKTEASSDYGDPMLPLVLSTAPKDKPTHWKQLSMLLDEGIAVRKGQKVKGTLEIMRNTYWRRHFNLDVSFKVNDGQLLEKSFGLWRYKTDSKIQEGTMPSNAL